MMAHQSREGHAMRHLQSRAVRNVASCACTCFANCHIVAVQGADRAHWVAYDQSEAACLSRVRLLLQRWHHRWPPAFALLML